MCCLTNFIVSLVQGCGMLTGVLVLVVVAAITLKVAYGILFPKRRRDAPIVESRWFGKDPAPNDGRREPAQEEDASVRPFKVDVPEELLEDLKRRLDNTRFEDPVEDSKFLYGFNPNYLRKVVDYWKKEYNWRRQEEELNRFSQFKTRIEGLDVHFLHVKPDLPEGSKLRVLPLMIVHGWPGSVVEFYKIIPLLTTPRPGQDFVFEVVCPSIPGFGFSESPHRKGFTVPAAARLFMTLMNRLGHRKFYVQGGDWGSGISQIMARFYPTRILGMHVNMYFADMTTWENIKYVFFAYFPFLVSKAEYRTAYPISRILKKILWQEAGYFHIQSTKPDTIGCAMADSPAGLAAYLLEKFCYWVEPENINLPDGGLTDKFTMNELLTNVMLYWINNNFTASVRFYKENAASIGQKEYTGTPVLVPSAVAVFPNEILMLPKTCMSQQMKNLLSYTHMPRGGHFAAFEEPELLADDVWKFVSLVEKQ